MPGEEQQRVDAVRYAMGHSSCGSSFTVEFGVKTLRGPAMSRLTFEAKAGFLFLVRKHVRGEIKMSDYRLP